MPDLLIRNIDPTLKRQLQERARARGRSLSEEAKTIIRSALLDERSEVEHPKAGLGTKLFSLLPAEYRGDDLVFDTPNDEVGEPPDFG